MCGHDKEVTNFNFVPTKFNLLNTLDELQSTFVRYQWAKYVSLTHYQPSVSCVV